MNSSPRTVTVIIPGTYGDTGGKIEVIKALRTLGGFGLKEAKELSESVGTHTIPVAVQAGQDYVTGNQLSAESWFQRSLRTLEAHGVTVEIRTARSQALAAVRHWAVESLHEGEYELAEALLAVLRRFD